MEIGKLIVSSEAIGKATASVKKFIDSICDKSSFVETDAFVTGKTFEDAAAALGEGVVTGYATLGGKPVHIFAQNAEVLKGSLGKAHADKIVKCMRRAVKTGTPLISVIDCGGARVGEGVGVLEGYAEVLAEAAIVSGQVPHFCVVKGNAVGMMSAFVAMADFAFMSKDAVLSLDSPMYLASTQKEFPALNKLLGYDAHKGGADIAQFSYKSEADLKKQLTALTDLLLGEVETKDDPNRVASALDKGLPAADTVKAIVDDGKVVEYCSDWAKDVVCALASVNGIAVGVVATDSSVGKGYISLDGARKIAAFVDKLDRRGIVRCDRVEFDRQDRRCDRQSGRRCLLGFDEQGYRFRLHVGDRQGVRQPHRSRRRGRRFDGGSTLRRKGQRPLQGEGETCRQLCKTRRRSHDRRAGGLCRQRRRGEEPQTLHRFGAFDAQGHLTERI